jgi:hypothetical protein
MSDFMPSSPKIDEIVNGTTGPEGIEAMRAAIKAALESSPQADPAPRPVQSAPQPRQTTVRVVYPHLNTRVELLGSSEADLDEQEKKIREFYGSR